MTTIKQSDFIQSIADSLQHISYYHPLDYITALAAAYEREQSPAAKDAIAQILTNSRMCAEGHRPICQDTGTITFYIKLHEPNCPYFAKLKETYGAKVVGITKATEQFNLVFTFGGDGTLLAASHAVSGVPILGVNSAPSHSVGFFCGAQSGGADKAICAAMRGTLAAPSLATMRALHRAGGCWLVSYDDDDSGDPVTTVEYFDGARALAEKEGDNPVRWVAVDRCGRVCLPPQADATDGAP